MSKIVAFLKDESGAAAAEYVIIIAVMGTAIALGGAAFGTDLSSALDSIGTKISTAGTNFTLTPAS
jgi:pilus assembly protein Flp/PilA